MNCNNSILGDLAHQLQQIKRKHFNQSEHELFYEFLNDWISNHYENLTKEITNDNTHVYNFQCFFNAVNLPNYRLHGGRCIQTLSVQIVFEVSKWTLRVRCFSASESEVESVFDIHFKNPKLSEIYNYLQDYFAPIIENNKGCFRFEFR